MCKCVLQSYAVYNFKKYTLKEISHLGVPYDYGRLCLSYSTS